jgi:HAD superfamily hydrolase (TIGR01509 family)
MPMKLHHVGLEVQDLYAEERFYRVALGFAVRYRYLSRNTPGLRTVFLERDGAQLELLERPRSQDFLARRAFAPDHLSLEVADVDAEHARLTRLAYPGVALAPPRDTGDGFRELVLRDPEGNLVELGARVAPEPHQPLLAVVFDLDGTLVDSEENYFLADEALLRRRGVTLTREDKRRYIGVSGAEMMRDLVRRFALRDDPLAMAREKDALYLELAERNTLLYPQMKRFWDLLRARGVPVAVASGSAPRVIARLLDLVGISGEVEVVVSCDEVGRAKPAPDVFLEAARRLGLPPQSCAAVEDSRPGVEAAHRAFMPCVAVPYVVEKPLAADFALAELLFEDGMPSFDPARALAWFEARAATPPPR